MDADRWQRLAPWLDELLDAPTDARNARLASLRTQDAGLADDLERLIALEDDHGDFLSEPWVSPQAPMRPGIDIGPYRLERLLGEGGMGQVWLAERNDGLLQRRVALKLLRPGLVESDLRARFARERQILVRLAHQHIARLLDAGSSRDGVPYLALEYIDGIPLTDWCRAQAAPLGQRVAMLAQVCDAVSHAHANLVVHRDLKPSNILVTPAGEVRLLDFGIAKLLDGGPGPDATRTGMRAFTLHYAAPEQILGEPVTTMTDVYALGVVLYELLTDHKPYRPKRPSDAAWEEAILSTPPLRASAQVLVPPEHTGVLPPGARTRAAALAGDLDNILLKALAKSPEARYPSAEALGLDLQRYLAGKPVSARGTGLARRISTLWRRRRSSVLGVAAVLATVVLAFGLLGWQAWQAQREAARARAAQRAQAGVLAAAARQATAMPGADLPAFLDAATAHAAAWPSPAQRRAVQRLLVELHLQRGDAAAARAMLARVSAPGHATTAAEALELRLLAAQLDWVEGDREACLRRLRAGLADARALAAVAPSLAGAVDAQHARCLPRGDVRAARLFERAAARHLLAGDPATAARIRAERDALDQDAAP